MALGQLEDVDTCKPLLPMLLYLYSSSISSFNWTAASDLIFISITLSMLRSIYKIFSLEEQEVRKCLKADFTPLRLFYTTTAGDSARKMTCQYFTSIETAFTTKLISCIRSHEPRQGHCAA